MRGGMEAGSFDVLLAARDPLAMRLSSLLSGTHLL